MNDDTKAQLKTWIEDAEHRQRMVRDRHNALKVELVELDKTYDRLGAQITDMRLLLEMAQ